MALLATFEARDNGLQSKRAVRTAERADLARVAAESQEKCDIKAEEVERLQASRGLGF